MTLIVLLEDTNDRVLLWGVYHRIEMNEGCRSHYCHLRWALFGIPQSYNIVEHHLPNDQPVIILIKGKKTNPFY
jgi:hypothetical protein